FHFFGVQIVEPEAFSRVPPDTPYETVSGLYRELIAEQPGSVRAFRCAAEYLDIGTPSDYLRTSLLVASREGHDQLIGARARIDPTAHLENAILWDDVEIGRDVTLRNAIVTDGVAVPSGSSWQDVAIRRFDGELAPGERREGDLAVMGI